ncbi:MAG: carbohydrate ABC transporter substrate-binding protein [Chloroflexi bacterium]|nr:carbohydrate ABC transporter substrate-binding protein [Chloroflexota bacterium]
MTNKKGLSRRDFLRLSAASAAGLVAASYAEPAAAETRRFRSRRQQTVLQVGSTNPEYENAERQIWNIFEQEYPDIKIELFSTNEDQAPAFAARLAGGDLPAFFPIYHLGGSTRVTRDNYQNFVDLSTTDFPWFDRWTYDVQNAWSDLYGLDSGPRSLDPYQGFIFTWMYHRDLMEDELGLSPREVNTWDDFLALLAAGTEAVAANDDIDQFWGQAWHNWAIGGNYVDIIPMAFADGQRSAQRAAFENGTINAPDSPFRHFFEFFKTAYDNQWLPENFWTLEWEADMEVPYIAKKVVMMLHGPWPWDKMLAADPSADQAGIPATPPVEGQEVWKQFMGPLGIDNGFVIPAGNQDSPDWEAIQTAFAWWFSPLVVKLRAELEGRGVMYETDEPLELLGPQYLGVLQELEPGGVYESVQLESGLTGAEAVARYRREGSSGVWDWEAGGLNPIVADVMTGDMSVQQALDWAQENWEASYDMP